jgi:hypothetical protein
LKAWHVGLAVSLTELTTVALITLVR